MGDIILKLDFVNRDAIRNIMKKGTLVLATGAILCSLPGCSREVSTNANVKYDVIDTMDEELVVNGIQQRLDVPGENFDLVVDYRCALEENAKWTVTSDKEMYIGVHTDGLDDKMKVFIDNVHIDTTIRSVYPSVDGITQDTMDDRIHNSQMLGFPISDDNTYSTVNCVEGQNQTFMQGSFYGFNGYSSGTVSEERYVESDYLAAGVYANKINSIIDLIIQKEDGTTTCVSVPSTIGISVWPYIERVNTDGSSMFRYYYYNENDGKVEYKDYTMDEYEQQTHSNKQYHK